MGLPGQPSTPANSARRRYRFRQGSCERPSSILQADDAINYGAIGTIIGHEITHGYDDSGANFDALGNLKNWWTEAIEEFRRALTSVINQFSVSRAERAHLQGKLVSGESIADLGGLLLIRLRISESR